MQLKKSDLGIKKIPEPSGIRVCGVFRIGSSPHKFSESKTSAGGGDPENVLQYNIVYKSHILGVGAESCAFQRESTESGECAEESDKYDGEILLVGLEFGAAVDKEEPGDKSPGHVLFICIILFQ